ncbi:MAG: hypothetical protein ABI759_08040 [Candidatus Solibacter sp.]
MAKTVPMIGIEPAELEWIRGLVALLRHPDPVVPELTRQALRYLQSSAAMRGVAQERESTAAERNAVPGAGA